MLSSKWWAVALAVGLVGLGCAGKDAKQASQDSSKTPSRAATSTKPTEPSSNGTATSVVSKPKPPAAVPAELQHDGYRFFGLPNKEPVEMTARNTANATKVSGAQTFKLEDVKDGEAIFAGEFSGGFAAQPAIEVFVRKDGVYARPKGDTGQEPQLQIPADPTPGKTWNATEKSTVNGQEMTSVTTSKVVGMRKLATKSGQRDALVIESNGTLTVDGVASKIRATFWLVKDHGQAKVEVVTRTPGQPKPVTTTIESL